MRESSDSHVQSEEQAKSKQTKNNIDIDIFNDNILHSPVSN